MMIDKSVGQVFNKRYQMMLKVMEHYLEPLSAQLETAAMPLVSRQIDVEIDNLINLFDVLLAAYPAPHQALNRVYTLLSKYLSFRGYYQQKIEWGQALMQLIVDAGETLYVSLIHRVANAYQDSGQYEDALRLFHFIVSAFQDEPDHPGLGLAYSSLASIYNRLEKPNEAIHFYQVAIEIEEKLDAPDRLAQDLMGLADVYHGNGYLEAGYTIARRAYTLAEQIDNPYLLAEFTSDLATHMCGGHCDPAEIEPMFELAIQRLTALDNQIGLAKTCFNYALFFRWQHQYDRALELAQRSLKIYEAHHSGWTAHVRQRLAAWANELTPWLAPSAP